MGASGGRLIPEKIHDVGCDMNTNTVTTEIDTFGRSHIGIFVCNKSGTCGTHVSTVQISPDDGHTWFDTDDVITGQGFIKNDIVVCEKVRVKVTTPEGGASTADIIVIVE